MIYRKKFDDIKSNHYDCVVIGSGMAGMTCAAALAQTGHRILLLEQHYVPGGMTHTFKRKGFIWDVGVHALGEMDKKNMPGKILSWLSNDQIKMNRFGDGADQIYDNFNFPDGVSFGLPSNSRVLVERLKERFPDETAAIDQYFELVSQAGKSGRNYFFLKTKKKWVNQLLNPLFNRQFKKWSQLTTKEVLDGLFKSSQLKAILAAQWGYYGVTPSRSSFYIHAATFRHFWNGAYYPEGTAKTIAESLMKVIEEKAGDILVRTKVEKILVKNHAVHGVQLTTGEIISCKKIVAATSAKIAINQFLDKKDRKPSYGKDINQLRPTPCHICLYLGFEGNIDETEATASNQWIFETWDHEKMIWDAADRSSVAPCLYVSFPTKKDHVTHADETNQFTAEVVTFVPWEQFERWKDTTIRKRGDDYNEFKESMQERVIAQMKQHFPKLMEKMTYCEFSTPLSTVFYCESPAGSIYGLEATPERFLCHDLRPHTPVKGYYLSGSDVATCGVVGALMGGFLTAATIDKKVIKAIS